MMNNIARLGPEIAMSRSENLHTSGHAYRSASLLLNHPDLSRSAYLYFGWGHTIPHGCKVLVGLTYLELDVDVGMEIATIFGKFLCP